MAHSHVFLKHCFSISLKKIGITERQNRQVYAFLTPNLRWRSERAGDDPGERGDDRIHVNLSLWTLTA